jgi:hypothetical protein
MNIDISNAHCGFRTLSVTHAWPRVARHSNPPGRRLSRRRTGARGRAQPAVGFTPDRSAAASQVASLNVTLADRAGGAALAASPTRPAGFTAPRRHGPSSRRALPPPGAGRRRRWRTGAGGGARRTIERCRRRPARGFALVGANCLRARAPLRRPRAARRRPRANRLRDLGSGETTRRI